MPDTHANPMEKEGVPQRRAADHRNTEPLQWIEEGPHATLMTPERVLAILGKMQPGSASAMLLAEQVEIEVRREYAELVEVVRTLAAVARQHRHLAETNPHVGISYDCDHVLHHTQPLIQAAQRLCLHFGYNKDGADIFVEPPALNPEHMLERLEKQQRDYGDIYRWLRAQSQRAGFEYVCDAIAYATQSKKEGA